MIRVLSIIIATLLTCYIAVTAFFFRDVKENRLCEGLQIVVRDSLDKHFVTNEDLVYLLKKSKLYPVKKPMDKINTEKIETELLNNDMISHVESPSGNYYIDNIGSMMPLSRHYVAHVLVASGYVEKEFAKNELYKFALYLQDNEFWNDQIEQIYVDADKNVELIPRVGNHRIILGSFDNFPEKLDNLKLFYEQAIPKVGWEKYSAINLKYKNQIVCTKR